MSGQLPIMLSRSLLKPNTLGVALHEMKHKAFARTIASMIAAYAAVLLQYVLFIRSSKFVNC